MDSISQTTLNRWRMVGMASAIGAVATSVSQLRRAHPSPICDLLLLLFVPISLFSFYRMRKQNPSKYQMGSVTKHVAFWITIAVCASILCWVIKH